MPGGEIHIADLLTEDEALDGAILQPDMQRAINGILHYAGADSFVRNGAFATCGVNYTDLGTKTAEYAFKAMTEGMDGLEDYYLMDGGIITVNTETAEAAQADYSVFADMGELVEVQTTEE